MEDTYGRMFGPLNFKEYHPKNLENSEETPCLLCNDIFNLKLCFNVFLQHLFEVHQLVIEDVQNIYNLSRYVEYWKKRFDTTPIDSIVPSVKVEPSDCSYLLLSSLMKEDKELRLKLNLEKALDTQEKERTDDKFEKDCLFCRLQYKGTRYEYLDHLSTQHNLHLGNPQNLVFIDELITKIEDKLNSLQCIYCEKTFTERSVLKEHMRKKLHKRINPQNRDYDRYYMINYLEERTKKSRRHKDENPDEDLPVELGDQNPDGEYSDWQENEDAITCLFCEHTEFKIIEMCLHMHTVHQFNFPQLAAHLDFYQRVKLVNFLRRQVHSSTCPHCNEKFENLQELLVHLKEMKHCRMPEIEKFDQPEFYFPTYENDTFLYFLEDIED